MGPLFIPPHHYPCLSFPVPPGSSWVPQAVQLAPPEPFFRDMALLRMTRAFDPEFYLEQHEDISNTQRDPYEHYMLHGQSENRRPHPDFRPAFYRKHNDLAPGANPFLHFLLEGAPSGQPPMPDWSPDNRDAEPHPFEYAGLPSPLESVPQPVWLDFQTRAFEYDQGRHALALGLSLLETGHPVLLRREGFFRSPPPSVQKLLRQPGVWILPSSEALPPETLRIHDHDQPPTGRPGRSIRIRITSRPEDDGHLPYSLHPSILLNRAHRFLRLARDRRRTLGIFFSGQNPHSYRVTPMAKRHGLLNRYDVLRVARNHLRDRLRDPSDPERAIVLARPEAPPALLTENKTDRIVSQSWLDRLGYARFFLCPPGALHPLSHNLVEALAVGTVPILEYGHVLHPPLRDGVNCLSFNGADQLCEVLDAALAMPEARWEVLHRNAIRYYEQHLRYPERLRSLLRPESGPETLSLPFRD